MNINLGDILDAASKRMDIANEADRATRGSSYDPVGEAHENNRRVISEMDKMGMDTSNIRGRI